MVNMSKCLPAEKGILELYELHVPHYSLCSAVAGGRHETHLVELWIQEVSQDWSQILHHCELHLINVYMSHTCVCVCAVCTVVMVTCMHMYVYVYMYIRTVPPSITAPWF